MKKINRFNNILDTAEEKINEMENVRTKYPS